MRRVATGALLVLATPSVTEGQDRLAGVVVAERAFAAASLARGTRAAFLEFLGPDIDFAGGEFQIDHIVRTIENLAGHSDDVFIPQPTRGCVHLCTFAGIEYELSQSISVAKVDEDESAMITITGDPSTECCGLANVFQTEFTARMSS